MDGIRTAQLLYKLNERRRDNNYTTKTKQKVPSKTGHNAIPHARLIVEIYCERVGCGNNSTLSGTEWVLKNGIICGTNWKGI